ncbi:MAG: alpha/beta hydrolase-fold protein [Planctomycetota bacterium]|nr:alpha/beta hydrolase-fold protein [Planctomycetota bacterium]
MPDCWTRLGGSQFVNSTMLGRYTDYLVEEVVPMVDACYATRPGARGVVGKSSGGFGAMHLCLDHPGVFRACGSISGDVDFELGYAAEFLPALRGLVDHGMDPGAFLDAFLTDPTLRGDDHAVLSMIAMAACYSPNPASPLGCDLPFELHTGERIDAVWQRWLAFDPLQRIEAPAAQEAWRSLELLHLECGLKDQFHLQWGLRKLHGRLDALGIPHDHVEHPGSHFDINDRYPPLISKVARALAR